MIRHDDDDDDDDGRAWFLRQVDKVQSQDLWGSFLREHLRRQKSILLLTIISNTTIMSTVTSDTPIAKVPQTSDMRKNGESFPAP
jgi:hypothetical protein